MNNKEKEIIQFYQNNFLSLKEVANHFNYKTGESIRYILLKNNIPLHKKNEIIKNTNQKKYGVDNVMFLQTVKKKIKQTWQQKYNTDHPWKLPTIRQKIKNTMKQKYNVEHNWNNGVLREKLKKTWFNMYGEENPAKSEQIKKKKKQTFLLKYGKEHPWLDKRIQKLNFLKRKITCYKKYGVTIPFKYQQIQNKINQTIQEKATHNSFYTSDIEKQIKHFIESLNFIPEKDFICRNRSIIGKELDFYFPKLNIAIEINGIYYHSMNHYNFNNNYKYNSYNKLKLCREKKIDLITIWEDLWIKKKEIIKQIIKHRLHKSENIIQARKCIIKDNINNKEYKDFCDKHHIQGYRSAKIRIGLYYNNELVQVASFNKCYQNGKKSNKYDYEWIRGCISSNNAIIGGTSKLLKYFIKQYNPESILCFSDNNLFNGNGYEKVGFKLINEIKIDKFYVVRNSFKRINRNPFKYKELMQQVKENKLFLCYGCGSKKFIWRKS